MPPRPAAKSGKHAEQAGLPGYGGRRRASGLRREEVALLVESVSTTAPGCNAATLKGLSDSVLGRLDDPLLGNIATILIPFTTYSLAELIHDSGVLAVVSASSS
jgi:NhaP-type Na+/H+ or K+/H+ antiporter